MWQATGPRCAALGSISMQDAPINDWRICDACASLSRAQYYFMQCAACGSLTREATADELTKRPASKLSEVRAIKLTQKGHK
jgi:hypothetical protein